MHLFWLIPWGERSLKFTLAPVNLSACPYLQKTRNWGVSPQTGVGGRVLPPNPLHMKYYACRLALFAQPQRARRSMRGWTLTKII